MKIKIGSAAINTTPIGWKWNFTAITEAMKAAQVQGVRLLCLPELCITGYGCEDLFFRAHVRKQAIQVAEKLAKDSATADLITTVGLPLEYQGVLYNVVAVLNDGVIRGFYAKQNLAGDGVHYEPRWFKPWPQAKVVDFTLPSGAVVPLGDTTFEFDLGHEKATFGFEICEDAWVAERPGIALAKAAVDLILNPSASHFSFGKTHTRERFVIDGSRAFNCVYVYANLLGNESGRIVFDGECLIAHGGELITKGRRFGYGRWRLTTAVIDLEIIRRLLARVWWHARTNQVHEAFTSANNEIPKLIDVLRGDTALRRVFIDDLATQSSLRSADQCHLFGNLTNTDDFSHFLAMAESEAQTTRMVYAQLTRQTYDVSRHASYWDQLLAALGRSVELRSAFSWLREWTLDASDSLQQKEWHYGTLRWQTEAEKMRPKKSKPDPVTIWTRDLEHLAKGNPEDWLTLAHNLFIRGNDTKSDDEARANLRTSPDWEYHDAVRADLRNSPGWKYHNEAGHARILAGARRLLLEVPGNPSHQLGSQSEFDRIAYRALYLLKNEIEDSPELAEAVKRAWLPTVFDEFSNSEDHHLEMMALIYRLDPAAVRTLLKAKILQDATREGGITIVLREFARCWDPPLANSLIEVAATEVTNAVTVNYIMQYLAENDPEAGRQLWLRLKATRRRHPKRYTAGLSALASWRLFDFWDQIWSELKADSALAKDVLVGIDVLDQRNFLNRSNALTERRLADLYLLMREVFPPSEDPAIPTGRSYTPTRRMEISRLRDELPATLAAMGTNAAADELERIAKTLPSSEAIWMRWRVRDAVVAQRRKAWQPPTTSLVVSLVHKSNRRWLTDEADLLALVQESIGRFQDNLKHKPNSFRRQFWRSRKSKAGTKYFMPKNEVELSEFIAAWFEIDLPKHLGITVQREVSIQWNKRTDIEVRAVAVAGEDLRPLEITVEVKGCWHVKVRSALKDQLVDDYLAGSGRTHGLYLVVWTTCARWNDPLDKRRLRWKLKTLRETQETVEKLATDYDGIKSPFLVRTAVLDARL